MLYVRHSVRMVGADGATFAACAGLHMEAIEHPPLGEHQVPDCGLNKERTAEPIAPIVLQGDITMKLTKLILIASIVALAATASAAAKIPTFKAVDANGDGSVDATEFATATAAGVKQTLAKLDKDGNGTLSKTEYSVLLGEDCE